MRRLAECKPKRRAHERSGAGAGDDHREYAGKEAAGESASIGHVAAHVHQVAAKGDHARERQPHGDEQVGEDDDKQRRLQLESPADCLSGLLQGD